MLEAKVVMIGNHARRLHERIHDRRTCSLLSIIDNQKNKGRHTPKQSNLPTNRKPCLFRSWLSLSDASVLAGIGSPFARTRGLQSSPPTHCLRYVEKLLNSFCSFRILCAFVIE